MFEGWSRRNNPQAKVLTTVPKAAWHQGVVYGVTRAPGHLLEYWSLTPACGALQERTEYFSSYSWEGGGGPREDG